MTFENLISSGHWISGGSVLTEKDILFINPTHVHSLLHCYLCPTWYFDQLALGYFLHTVVAKLPPLQLPSLLATCFRLVNKLQGKVLHQLS